MPRIATVRLLDAPFRADSDYDYLLPDGESEDLVGRLCTVPFGFGNRGAHAVITAVRTGESERKLKTVATLYAEDLRVLPEILKLCFFLAEHTLCSVGEAVRAAVPAAALGLLYHSYRAAEPVLTGENVTPERFSSAKPKERKALLLGYLSDKGECTEENLKMIFGKAVSPSLAALVKEGLAVKSIVRRAEAKSKTERVYVVAAEREEAEHNLRFGTCFKNDTQAAIYRFLLEEGECPEAEIAERLNITPSRLQTMVKNGLLLRSERSVERNPYERLSKKRDTAPVALSAAQQAAYDKLAFLLDAKKAACALLHGVTGSGKTCVMMKLLDKVLGEGGQAILMVPEIALTPQTVGIFCSRYGERVSVLHSSLSLGERYDAYRKILRGEADLVIGTRSAVFAPLSRLSLIIIDEEHEHTYKSDASPRYHTRDVAAYRCGVHGALTVLASATPSLESYYKAETGKYTLVPLTERYGNAKLPETEIVDMREELRAGNTSPLSRRLEEALLETKEQARQSILFLNRRGYHHAISCKNCGEPLVCEHCSVSLTYHTNYTGGYLLCHACGMKKAMPKACPSCASEHLSYVGAGTQKAEAEIKSLAPDMHVLRMDADTTGTKSAYERILGRFRKGDADVLLGTQMVTKGHDFPAVTLSGVLLADASLYMHDFRASERTFALLTQVIGRAGRADMPGKAIIQTYSPTHKTILLAAAQDYPSFYQEEIALRRARKYPPFCDMAEVFLSSTDETELLESAKQARDKLIELFRALGDSVPVELYGPIEPQTYKIAEKYRMKLLLKCRLTAALRRAFAAFLREFLGSHPKMTVTVDFNPTDT